MAEYTPPSGPYQLVIRITGNKWYDIVSAMRWCVEHFKPHARDRTCNAKGTGDGWTVSVESNR